MKETKEIKIRYRSGVQHKGTIEGKEYKEYTYDYTTASTEHVKRYKNALMLLMGISGCELHLIEWLTQNMTDGNYITNNELTRKAFIAFHEKYKKSGNKSYSDHSVKKAFQNLATSELLLPAVRGVYIINPIYYFSGEDSKRVKSIKVMMEFRAGVDTKITVETIKTK